MTKVTISEIARRAGVSKTAVSFAFNYPERLSEDTLRHILTVAEEVGYAPDPVASNLKTRRTGCIGILVPQPIPIMTRNPYLLKFIEGVGDVCHESGMSLMLVPPLKGSLRRAIVRAAVDGFLTLGLETFRGTMVVLQQRGVPFVMVDSDPTPEIPCVNIDDEGGAYAAMSYALARGHRQIAIFGIRSGHHGDYHKYAGTLQRRITGYARALAEHGLSLDAPSVHLLECECDAAGGYEGLHALWPSRCGYGGRDRHRRDASRARAWSWHPGRSVADRLRRHRSEQPHLPRADDHPPANVRKRARRGTVVAPAH